MAIRLASGLSLLVLFSACATDPAVQPPEPTGGVDVFETPTPKEQAVTTPKRLTEKKILTLAEAMSRALLRNPELEPYAIEIRAREAREIQANLHPNPEFGLEIEEFAGSDERSQFDGAETTLQLSQADRNRRQAGEPFAAGETTRRLDL